MKAVVFGAALVMGQWLLGGSPTFAQDGWHSLAPARMRAYHACLFEAWIEDYCRRSSASLPADPDRVYTTCLLANGGGRFLLAPPYYDGRTDDYCWSLAQSRPLRR